MNKTLFGGSISSVVFYSAEINTNTNGTVQIDDNDDDDDETADDSGKSVMNDQSMINEEAPQAQPPTQTSYTTVTYKTLDTGLSITISETITITNNNFDKLPINNKNYELILVPTTNTSKTVVVPSGDTNDKPLLPPPVTTATATSTNTLTKATSNPQLNRPLKPINDANFAYIDESSDDRTLSSVNGITFILYLVIVHCRSFLCCFHFY